MANNIHDVALIFEGGGMRASYTSAAVNTFLENGIHFDNVYGVSAGASNSVNYLSRDIWRTCASFTDLADDPDFGGVGTFLLRKGIFNARYIYQESGKPDGKLPFKYEKFQANPGNITIQSFNRDTGETIYWTRDDLDTLEKLMVRVRASSSLPLLMPATLIDGRAYYDGGLGEGAGIMLPKAQSDGFEKFFVVCTRPKGYRKQEKKNSFINTCLWKRPHVRSALRDRSQRYNDQIDKLEALQAEGKAYLFYASEQGVESGERNSAKLRENYAKGYAQAQKEVETWAQFLGI